MKNSSFLELMKLANQDFKQRIKKNLFKQKNMHHIGFNLDLIKAVKMEGRMALSKIYLQQPGLAHGGFIATVADVVVGFSAYLWGNKNEVVTDKLKITYLRPAIGETFWAKGWVLKQDRKINFCEAKAYVLRGNGLKWSVKMATSMIIT